MSLRIFLTTASLAVVGAFTATGRPLGLAGHRSCGVSMFEDEDKASLDVALTKVTRSRESRLLGAKSGGRIVVTDGTGSFYKSRKMVQTLHDFGEFGQITAFSSSIAEAKKMLLSRQSRYSGLNDALDFQEGDLASALDGAAAWLVINADEAELPAQIAAAKAAGVSRAFILLSADGPTAALGDVPAIEQTLASAGVDYTVMRTGRLVDADAGAGLKLDDVEQAVCDDVAQEDVCRFITEALTLPEASRRLFSLCPSERTESSLKQMRYAGYERREEVQMLLAGLIKEQEDEEVELSPDEKADKAEAVMRSSAEVAAEREEELKALLARAKERGEATAKRLAYEEAEKEAHRKEQEQYYKAPLPKDDSDQDA